VSSKIRLKFGSLSVSPSYALRSLKIAGRPTPGLPERRKPDVSSKGKPSSLYSSAQKAQTSTAGVRVSDLADEGDSSG
jgi:hypothetical protein